MVCFYLDIDDCKFLCKSQAQECTNTDGSYTCVCKNGARGDGNICSGMRDDWFKSFSTNVTVRNSLKVYTLNKIF